MTDIKYINPLTLAYLGDAVYELRVREHLLEQGELRMPALHNQAVSLVNAERQSLLFAQIEDMLSEDELAVFRRGRNAKGGRQPIHSSVTSYRRATGVEALIGYLYLSGQKERLDDIFAVLFAEDKWED